MRGGLLIPAAVFLYWSAFLGASAPERLPARSESRKHAPGDWFYRQRAFPLGIPDGSLRALSLRQAEALRGASGGLGAAVWVQKGPSNIGGRVTTMAISSQNPACIYLGAADGGVWKTPDRGATWVPLTDHSPSLSMGALAVDPSDDRIVYAGTGEVNSSGDSYDGEGIFKTTDGGGSWHAAGLQATRRIGKILVDPADTRILYCAAMGGLYSAGPDRGVYKSTDAGSTWAKVLFLNDTT
ncbi:MAG: hypothetical protein WB626_03185, partial [Bacteroidota bacterium]